MSSFDAQPNGGFHRGDRVRALTGNLACRVGAVVEIRSGVVIVEYDVFGKPAPVEHDSSEIERVADPRLE